MRVLHFARELDQQEYLVLLGFLALLVHYQVVVYPVPLVYLWEVSVHLQPLEIVDLAI